MVAIDHVGNRDEPDWEGVVETSDCDWSRGPVYSGRRLSPKQLFQRLKKAQVGFWNSCCGGRGHSAIKHLAWTVRQSFCSWTPEGGKAMLS